MHATGSYLLTVIERMRAYLDEAVQDAKYDNDWIVRHLIAPEQTNVLSRLNMDRDDPLLMELVISMVSGQRFYTLPPNVGEILRVCELNSDATVKREWLPKNEFSRWGPVWRSQENLLEFVPVPSVTQDIVLKYIPTGDYLPHYATDGTLVEVDGEVTQLELSTAPALGARDERMNAYAGGILRILKPTATPSTELFTIEEQVIESHDTGVEGSTPAVVNVRRPFTKNAASANITYEIAPMGIQSLYNGIVFSGVISMAAMRSVSQKQMGFFQNEYRKAMKTIMDTLSNKQMRVPKHYEKATVDNRDDRMWWVGR